MSNKTIALKIDVDTERGTRIGLPNMLNLLEELNIPATILLSLGPDNTGKTIKRIFRKNFFKNNVKSNFLAIYGIKTLMNGLVIPGPHIAKKHRKFLQTISTKNFDIGIHCYDHVKWQDNVHVMKQKQIDAEFNKAINEYENIFGPEKFGAGAPGWQANKKSFATYDKNELLYGSDCRGKFPFYPKINRTVFKTLQIPTTLPTLDEVLRYDNITQEIWTEYFLANMQSKHPNVFTCHTELEGMKYFDWFKMFLKTLQQSNYKFVTLKDITEKYKDNAPVCNVYQKEILGRSGCFAVQSEEIVKIK